LSEPPAASVPTLAIVALALAAFGASAAARVTDPMLPALAKSYGVGLGTAAGVVTLFTLAYGSFQIVYGPIGDRFGKYRVIAWACVACALSSFACAAAPTFGALTAARFFAGATAAAIIPLSMAWIGDTLPYERRQPVLARFLIGQMCGFAAGSLMGGLGAEHLGTRAPFAFLGVWFAAAGAIVFGLARRMHGPPTGVRPPASPAALAVGIAYVWRQRWARVVLATVFLEGTFFFGAFTFIATHLHRHYDVSLTFAGTLVMLYGIGGVFFAVLSTMLVRRLGEVGLANTGGVVICATLLTIAATSRWPLAALALVLMGTGFYMLHNTLQTNATQLAPERRGTAVSQFAACLFLGQSTGVALAGVIAERFDTSVVLACGALGVLGVGCGFARLRSRHQRAVETLPRAPHPAPLPTRETRR
jgi:predicted MFS family arabinose efflux permease